MMFLVFIVDNEMLVNLKIWQRVRGIVIVMQVSHVQGLSLFADAIRRIDFTSLSCVTRDHPHSNLVWKFLLHFLL